MLDDAEPNLDFRDARHGLLEATADQEGITLLAVLREYNHEDFSGVTELLMGIQ